MLFKNLNQKFAWALIALILYYAMDLMGQHKFTNNV